MHTTRRSAVTRESILDAALGLFRRRGFDKTTMREVAHAAGTSLGAAYYYFAAKEDLVHAYYARMQSEHEELAAKKMSQCTDLTERLSTVLTAKLDLIQEDRLFLGAIFRYAAEREHPLSVFSEATAPIREKARAIIGRALEGLPLDEPIRALAIEGLWLAELGLIFYALHDPTKDLQRTRALVGPMVRFVGRGCQLLVLPGAHAFLQPLLELMQSTHSHWTLEKKR